MISSLSGFAQMPFGHGSIHQGGHNPEMREEVAKYFQQNILPVLLEKRVELEEDLISEERAIIDYVRAKMPVFPFRNQQSGHHWKELRDEQREEIRSHWRERRKSMMALIEIVDNHHNYFDNLRDQLSEQLIAWSEDIATIKSHYLIDEEVEEPRAVKDRPDHWGPPNFGPLFRPIRFLLLDSDSDSEGLVFNVFPNPASDWSQIDYEVITASDVTIKILNEQGSDVKTLVNEFKQPGKYSIETDLDHLRGVYYYQIITPSGIETRRILTKN